LRRVDHAVEEAEVAGLVGVDGARREQESASSGWSVDQAGKQPGEEFSAGEARRANAVVSLSPWAPKRRSAQAAWMNPMSAQAPLIAATIGFGMEGEGHRAAGTNADTSPFGRCGSRLDVETRAERSARRRHDDGADVSICGSGAEGVEVRLLDLQRRAVVSLGPIE